MHEPSTIRDDPRRALPDVGSVHGTAGDDGVLTRQFRTDQALGELRDCLVVAETRAARAEATIAESMSVLRQAEQMLQRFKDKRSAPLPRERDQEAGQEAAIPPERCATRRDGAELDAAIERASQALAELDTVKRRALDAEWRAARAEARVEQLLKATKAPAAMAGASTQAAADAAIDGSGRPRSA